ncbi:MAG: hypothetical protein HW401_58 [Parcubacteria group bacterium]|nr:hypothetical protein [Parcubacteria group bacterium]
MDFINFVTIFGYPQPIFLDFEKFVILISVSLKIPNTGKRSISFRSFKMSVNELFASVF